MHKDWQKNGGMSLVEQRLEPLQEDVDISKNDRVPSSRLKRPESHFQITIGDAAKRLLLSQYHLSVNKLEKCKRTKKVVVVR